MYAYACSFCCGKGTGETQSEMGEFHANAQPVHAASLSVAATVTAPRGLTVKIEFLFLLC